MWNCNGNKYHQNEGNNGSSFIVMNRRFPQTAHFDLLPNCMSFKELGSIEDDEENDLFRYSFMSDR